MSDNGEYSVLQRGHKQQQQQQQQQQHVNKHKQLFTYPHYYYNYFRSLPKMCLKQYPVNIH